MFIKVPEIEISEICQSLGSSRVSGFLAIATAAQSVRLIISFHLGIKFSLAQIMIFDKHLSLPLVRNYIEG